MDGIHSWEIHITQSKAQLAAQQAQTDRIASLEAALVAKDVALEAALNPVVDPNDLHGNFYITVDWAGSELIPAEEGVGALIIYDLNKDRTKALCGLLQGYTVAVDAGTISVEEAWEELQSGLRYGMNKAAEKSEGVKGAAALAPPRNDARNRNNGGGFKQVGTVPMGT
jgi:hypothetical protein